MQNNSVRLRNTKNRIHRPVSISDDVDRKIRGPQRVHDRFNNIHTLTILVIRSNSRTASTILNSQGTINVRDYMGNRRTLTVLGNPLDPGF